MLDEDRVVKKVVFTTVNDGNYAFEGKHVEEIYRVFHEAVVDNIPFIHIDHDDSLTVLQVQHIASFYVTYENSTKISEFKTTKEKIEYEMYLEFEIRGIEEEIREKTEKLETLHGDLENTRVKSIHPKGENIWKQQ